MNEKKWNDADAEQSGKLSARALELRMALPEITLRESQLLALAEAGFSNGEIAEMFGTVPKTVDNQSSDARHKLQAPRTVALRDLLEYSLRNPKKK